MAAQEKMNHTFQRMDDLHNDLDRIEDEMAKSVASEQLSHPENMFAVAQVSRK